MQHCNLDGIAATCDVPVHILQRLIDHYAHPEWSWRPGDPELSWDVDDWSEIIESVEMDGGAS